MASVGVFCPTLHNYGGGEFVAVAIANTLAQNGYSVTLFTTKPVDSKAVRGFFGETLHPKIEAITQPTSLNIKGIMGFYQTSFPFIRCQIKNRHLHRPLLKLRFSMDKRLLHPFSHPKQVRLPHTFPLPFKPTPHRSRCPAASDSGKKPCHLRRQTDFSKQPLYGKRNRGFFREKG